MTNENPASEIRLVFQASVPFDDFLNAQAWYAMLKEMVKTQSPRSSLNGQIMKMLEPCCGQNRPEQLRSGVVTHGPPGHR